jgi:hypothetical protein
MAIPTSRARSSQGINPRSNLAMTIHRAGTSQRLSRQRRTEHHIPRRADETLPSRTSPRRPPTLTNLWRAISTSTSGSATSRHRANATPRSRSTSAPSPARATTLSISSIKRLGKIIDINQAAFDASVAEAEAERYLTPLAFIIGTSSVLTLVLAHLGLRPRLNEYRS